MRLLRGCGLVAVFPAYAGMSRIARRYLAAANGFPRLRGDEPLPLIIEAGIQLFSPPTRG